MFVLQVTGIDWRASSVLTCGLVSLSWSNALEAAYRMLQEKALSLSASSPSSSSLICLANEAGRPLCSCPGRGVQGHPVPLSTRPFSPSVFPGKRRFILIMPAARHRAATPSDAVPVHQSVMTDGIKPCRGH